MIATVAEIEPATPGFREVLIEPHLGPLTRVDASMPHPLGDISVSYRGDGDRLSADVTLPEGLAGTFAWNGDERSLHSGSQHLQLSASGNSE
ncbi:MAG: hypothetical protein HY508_03310 [Acidobacteria bacterium]|nr:hypothetical protein [Acidobacteriota bacterium]